MSIASRSTGSRDFAARARRRRLRRVLIALAVLAAVGVVGVLAWVVGWSDVLALRQVSVAGVDGEQRDEVVDVAQAPVGTPLARVDTGAIESRVGNLPETAEVEVHRSWPNTLTIEVTPREAVAAVESGGRWFGVDESGVLFDESGSRPEGLPVLDASSADEDDAVRAAGVRVLTRLPAAVLDLVDQVEAHSEADVRLSMSDGATVELGTPDEIARKAEVLLALIEAQDEAASVYDVSAPNHPAVTN